MVEEVAGVMLVTGTAIAVVGLVRGLVFLPNRPRPADQVDRPDPVGPPDSAAGESGHDVVRTA